MTHLKISRKILFVARIGKNTRQRERERALAHTHTYTYIYTHIYIYIHTHTQREREREREREKHTHTQDVTPQRAGVHVEHLGLLHRLLLRLPLRAVLRQLVVHQRPVPRGDGEHIDAVVRRGVECQAPHRPRTSVAELLRPVLAPHRDGAVKLADREQRPVIAPRTTQALGRQLVLGDGLGLGRPHAIIPRRHRRQLQSHRVVAQRLDRVGVSVLEDALGGVFPDDDLLVGAAARKALAVLRVRHAVDRVFVPAQAMHQQAVRRVVHEHQVAARDDELGAIGVHAAVVSYRTCLGRQRRALLAHDHTLTLNSTWVPAGLKQQSYTTGLLPGACPSAAFTCQVRTDRILARQQDGVRLQPRRGLPGSV